MNRSNVSLLRRRRQPQPDAPPWHPRAVGSLALWQLNGDIALFLPTDSTRGWSLPGGALEQDEDPEHALSRELLEKAGLHRQPMRLLVIESVRTDPARGKPAGENYIWQVEPLTHQEWNSIRLPPKELKGKRLVPPSELGRFIEPRLEPGLERRVRSALKAQTTGTTLYLRPSH